MGTISLFPIFIVGLLGSVHCVGMCGGIVGAFSMAAPAKSFPVKVVAGGAAWPVSMARVLAYNLGRVGSYMVAGAAAGGLARGALALASIATLQTVAYWLANLMLVALGLYLMGAWRGLNHLELAGRGIWRQVQPLAQRILPLDRTYKLLLAGAIWGWLPCGMVYSMLFTALLSGSAVGGAAVMAAFGLGTLPTLLAMGVFGAVLRGWALKPAVRLGCGVLVIGYGLFGLAQASHVFGFTHASWLDNLCISSTAGTLR